MAALSEVYAPIHDADVDISEPRFNLWIVHHYANTPDQPGDARHFSYAREMQRRGHTVRIIACSFQHQNHEYLPNGPRGNWRHEVHDGVPFTWINASSYKGESVQRILNMFQFSFRALNPEWATGLERPDIVMGSSPHPFAALAAERLAARHNAPFLLEIRDPWPFVLTQVGKHSRFHPFVVLVDRVMRYLYRRADAIIMFSRNSAPLLSSLGAAPGKISWIPHGVDFTMSPEPTPVQPGKTFTVSYIGAHNQWNSLDAILDAAKILQLSGDRRIIIQFVGGGNAKPALMRRAAAEDIRNVRFLDALPKKEVSPILHQSDCFILNNHKDEVSKHWMSFNKLYEYLAAGRPVVFGSYTENDPVRESGGGISVPADDAPALAQAMRHLAGCSQSELAHYAAAGRRHILAHYSVQVLANRFESLLRAAVNTRRTIA